MEKLKQLLMSMFFFILPFNVFSATTIYKTPFVKTYHQGTTCLCSEYSTLHALEVRYLQREGETIYLSRSAAQWGQLYDRFEEEIRGYRKNALIKNNECYSEASLPHNVIRQFLQYGNHPDNIRQTTVGINVSSGTRLKDTIERGNSYEEKSENLKAEINFLFGVRPMDKDFAKKIIKNDRWIGYMPSSTTMENMTKFIPPYFINDQLPLSEAMPLVRQETRSDIFKRIINSIKRGAPVPYCASTHCQSIDGVEVNEDGTIKQFYYAGSAGENDFIWGDRYGYQYNAFNGFIYLILD